LLLAGRGAALTGVVAAVLAVCNFRLLVLLLVLHIASLLVLVGLRRQAGLILLLLVLAHQ
jgi:hypothetical protein